MNTAKIEEKLITIDKNLNIDNLIVSIGFNLSLNADNRPVDGVLGVFKDKITVCIDNKITNEILLSTVKEFKCSEGIGCTFIEIVTDEGEKILCRGDMNCHPAFAAAAKYLNRYLSKGVFDQEYEKEINVYCPKCKRPYPPGSDICPRCVNKKRYLKRIWDIAKEYRWYVYLSVLLYFVISGVNLLMPYLNRILIDDYIKAEQLPKFTGFLSVVVLLFLVNTASQGLSVLRNLTLIEAGSRLIIKLRELIFHKIQLLSLSRVSKRTSGELMSRVTHDTSALQNFITYEMGEMIQQFLMLIGVGVLLFYYDWKLALMIILPAPLVMIVHRLTWSFLGKRYHKQWTLNAKSNSVLHDIFSGIRVVKSFGMEKAEIERYDKVIYEEAKIQASNERNYQILTPITNFLMSLGEFFLLYYVGSKILKYEMTLGEMQQFSAYVSLIYGPLRWMAFWPRRLVRVMTSVVKIFDVIDDKLDVADKEDAKDIEIEGYIDIENASFGYDNSANVLKDVSLHIKPGEMIGIVGKSGVGKSTLINLVMRLYDVDDGSIKIDGIDVRDISQDSLRSQIGVVLQETFLFSGTIYDNIAYAKPDATREEVITASKIAGAHQFIMKLPDAYNTKVGERGYTLSGGERQRVSIARALLHNPRILILDEATASLDTETEKQIQDALQKLIADRTTLAIAHRLSTLRNATRLIVLDKGTIAEVGTHEELISKKGIYYGLVMAQRQMSKMTKE